MGIFTTKMRKYIRGETRQSYSKEVQSEYDRKIRKYTLDGVADLILFSKSMPEEMQKMVFNEELLKPLFRNIFTLKSIPNLKDKDINSRRERILKLAYIILSTLGDEAPDLAPGVFRVVKWSSEDMPPYIQGLKAILIQTMGQLL